MSKKVFVFNAENFSFASLLSSIENALSQESRDQILGFEFSIEPPKTQNLPKGKLVFIDRENGKIIEP